MCGCQCHRARVLTSHCVQHIYSSGRCLMRRGWSIYFLVAHLPILCCVIVCLRIGNKSQTKGHGQGEFRSSLGSHTYQKKKEREEIKKKWIKSNGSKAAITKWWSSDDQPHPQHISQFFSGPSGCQIISGCLVYRFLIVSFSKTPCFSSFSLFRRPFSTPTNCAWH